MVGILAITFFSAYAIREARITFIHESAIAIFLGLLVGIVVRFISTVDQLKKLVLFDQVL